MLNSVCLVPSCLHGSSCHRAFAILPSWVQNVLLWLFRRFTFFCRGYFVGPKLSLVRISQVQEFFLWVFYGSKSFTCGYFMGPRFFLMGVLWVRNFFSRVLRGSELFSDGCFVGPKFFFVGVSWVQDLAHQSLLSETKLRQQYSAIWKNWRNWKCFFSRRRILRINSQEIRIINETLGQVVLQ